MRSQVSSRFFLTAPGCWWGYPCRRFQPATGGNRQVSPGSVHWRQFQAALARRLNYHVHSRGCIQSDRGPAVCGDKATCDAARPHTRSHCRSYLFVSWRFLRRTSHAGDCGRGIFRGVAVSRSQSRSRQSAYDQPFRRIAASGSQLSLGVSERRTLSGSLFSVTTSRASASGALVRPEL